MRCCLSFLLGISSVLIHTRYGSVALVEMAPRASLDCCRWPLPSSQADRNLLKELLKSGVAIGTAKPEDQNAASIAWNGRRKELIARAVEARVWLLIGRPTLRRLAQAYQYDSSDKLTWFLV